MEWQGKKLKELVENQKISQEKFCEMIGATRAAFNKWIKNEVIPNGKYLIAICHVLKIEVDELFCSTKPVLQPRYMPVHNQRCSEEENKAAWELAQEFSPLVIQKNSPALQLSSSGPKTDPEKLGNAFRALSGVKPDAPMDTMKIMALGEKLGLCIILTSFPKQLKKVYAFLQELDGVKVIFVDIESNALDFDFVLLHEICHAVCGHCGQEPDKEDEFCNKTAEYALFPQSFLDNIACELNKLNDSKEKINLFLKKATGFAPYCLFKALESRCNLNLGFQINREKLKTIHHEYNPYSPAKFFCEANDADDYLTRYVMFSRIFVHYFLLPGLENMTDRYLARVLNLDSIFDVAEFREKLMKLRGKLE